MAVTKKSIIGLLLAMAVCLAMLPQGASAAAEGSKGFSGKTITSKSADKIIRVAKSKRGCPYVSGAAGPNSFDCSGFVAYCMHKAGIKLTRGTAASYYKKAYNVGSNIKKAQKGDIVLYTAGGGIGHCALYVGNGNVIHATCSGGIRITTYYGIGQSVVAIIRTYTPAGSAKIQVKDNKNKSIGSKYVIYKKGFKKKVKVDKSGAAKVRDLKAGKYSVRPLGISKRFRDCFTKEIKVKNNKTIKVSFKNVGGRFTKMVKKERAKKVALKRKAARAAAKKAARAAAKKAAAKKAAKKAAAKRAAEQKAAEKAAEEAAAQNSDNTADAEAATTADGAVVGE